MNILDRCDQLMNQLEVDEGEVGEVAEQQAVALCHLQEEAAQLHISADHTAQGEQTGASSAGTVTWADRTAAAVAVDKLSEPACVESPNTVRRGIVTDIRAMLTADPATAPPADSGHSTATGNADEEHSQGAEESLRLELDAARVELMASDRVELAGKAAMAALHRNAGLAEQRLAEAEERATAAENRCSEMAATLAAVRREETPQRNSSTLLQRMKAAASMHVDAADETPPKVPATPTCSAATDDAVADCLEVLLARVEVEEASAQAAAALSELSAERQAVQRGRLDAATLERRIAEAETSRLRVEQALDSEKALSAERRTDLDRAEQELAAARDEVNGMREAVSEATAASLEASRNKCALVEEWQKQRAQLAAELKECSSAQAALTAENDGLKR